MLKSSDRHTCRNRGTNEEIKQPVRIEKTRMKESGNIRMNGIAVKRSKTAAAFLVIVRE